VGARLLHVVVLDDAGGLVESRVDDTASEAVRRLARSLAAAGVTRAAVDAPSGLSELPHVGDASLAPKFRAARCGEVALGRDRGIWVPWVSPAGPPVAPWIAVGLSVFAALAGAGIEAVETFPQAVFRTMNAGGRVPAKSRPEGIAARAALLSKAGIDHASLPLWSHDGLDAAAAALVAAGPSVAVTCGHDGSAIWLPA
ncbi:MAG TPA: DUF429 domain-containing protein, partial [Acidimicrobiales bacterium]|nr:DUF429 domain-containing protein [Acidimicrobiales bacterium]